MHELQALLLYISNLLTYLLTDLLPHVRLTTYSRELQAFVRSCVAASQARCEREGAPPPGAALLPVHPRQGLGSAP